MDCPKLLACNFRPKLPARTISLEDFRSIISGSPDVLYILGCANDDANFYSVNVSTLDGAL